MTDNTFNNGGLKVEFTDPPQFMEPDYSFKFEELTPEQRDRFYKRKYKRYMKLKEALKILGTVLIILGPVVFFAALYIRLIKELAVWGYTLFGVL